MRGYKLIALIAPVVLSLATMGVYADSLQRQQLHARETSVSEQERIRQLAEWEEQVRMWEQQAQAVAQSDRLAAQSDLEQQGVAMLPDTGPGHVAALVIVTTLLSGISYFLLTKYIFNR